MCVKIQRERLVSSCRCCWRENVQSKKVSSSVAVNRAGQARIAVSHHTVYVNTIRVLTTRRASTTKQDLPVFAMISSQVRINVILHSSAENKTLISDPNYSAFNETNQIRHRALHFSKTIYSYVSVTCSRKGTTNVCQRQIEVSNDVMCMWRVHDVYRWTMWRCYWRRFHFIWRHNRRHRQRWQFRTKW